MQIWFKAKADGIVRMKEDDVTNKVSGASLRSFIATPIFQSPEMFNRIFNLRERFNV